MNERAEWWDLFLSASDRTARGPFLMASAALLAFALVAVWPTPRHFLDFLFSGVVVWAVIELGVMPGEQGANRYGLNPLKPASAV
ncbi:MAG: hypothetical protein JF617_14845 [Burkholderiales bacterium]|nr:hypothetical protein [Burkholderiales bacterium]